MTIFKQIKADIQKLLSGNFDKKSVRPERLTDGLRSLEASHDLVEITDQNFVYKKNLGKTKRLSPYLIEEINSTFRKVI